MRSSADPAIHRQSEQQIIQHVERLLNDDRLRIDTTLGRRQVTAFTRDVTRDDRATGLRRTMSELGLPDRELEARMPIGQSIEVVLSQTRWFVFKKVVARLQVVCVSPTKALLSGQEPQPMATAELRTLLASIPPSLAGVPSTVVVVSTSGFTRDSHELADRRADRTVILAEPNGAGGWAITGPVETKALGDLFDPEAEEEKRRRVHEFIEQSRVDLIGSGLAADRIASRTQLPQQLVEQELKAFAKANPGIAAKRLDGRVVLFRAGSVAAPQTESGGSAMPLIDRVKTLFGHKGDNEKKIAFLSERRTALGQQRDRAYEDMGALEQQEAAMRQEFKDAGSITKRRLTSQLLQLRKDLERRQQLLTVLNQQINVVSTHLHNLELVQQGQTAKLPDTDEITADAVQAEEMLAQLEADAELAGSVSQVGSSGMTSEEQALYDELELESGRGPEAAVKEPAVSPQARAKAAAPSPEGPQSASAENRPQPRRSEPEAG